MSHHNAGNLTFIFSVFFNPFLSKLDVWTHPTLPKLLLNHHLHWVSYSASICTWCPSITLEIVFFPSLILLSLLNTNVSKWNAWTQSAHTGNRFHFLFHFFFIFGKIVKLPFGFVVRPDKLLANMMRMFQIYCSQGIILNSRGPLPYFCSPNLQFQGISFSFNHFVMVGHMEVGVFLIENNFVL